VNVTAGERINLMRVTIQLAREHAE
jgi:hypothetical protein